MVKIINAAETLKRMCYDVNKMVDNNTEPQVVLKMIKRKLKYLEMKKAYFKILWWNEDVHYHPKTYVHPIDKEYEEEELLIEGVTRY